MLLLYLDAKSMCVMSSVRWMADVTNCFSICLEASSDMSIYEYIWYFKWMVAAKASYRHAQYIYGIFVHKFIIHINDVVQRSLRRKSDSRLSGNSWICYFRFKWNLMGDVCVVLICLCWWCMTIRIRNTFFFRTIRLMYNEPDWLAVLT